MTVTMTADLEMTRLALEVAVDQLTRPGTERIESGDPKKPWRYAPVPSLLEQLDDARGANSGSSGGFSDRSKPPCFLDAVMLLAEIDKELRPYSRRPTRAERVRAWSGAMHAVTDPDVLDRETTRAEEWVRRVRTLLYPVATVDLPGRCPMCQTDRVEVGSDDDEHETVSRHALRAVEADEMTGAPTAWCTSCSKRFEGEALWLLADHLDRQLAHETLAVES